MAAGFVLIELTVPSKFVLLSAYSEWNYFLDDVIDGGDVPSKVDKKKIFVNSVDEDDDDYLQGVIPYIEPEWVRSVTLWDFSVR